MAPPGALVFKLEQSLVRANLDYAELQDLLRKEEKSRSPAPPSSAIKSRMLALRKQLGRKGYDALRLRAEAAAEKEEFRSLGEAQLTPGVSVAVGAGRAAGWWVIVASDLGKKPVASFLDQNMLASQVDMVVARARLDENRSLESLLKPAKSKLKSLVYSAYFCNNSREVSEARALGMKCFVLPSPIEPFRTLYQAGPTGIILSLEEVPQLLALPSMKLPRLVPAAKNPTRIGRSRKSSKV